ncbi:hypothetical protein MJN51_30730, partial [Salmonella enterica subsp. enterica serovar Kentucky]|nr:hypothetical protein [Salmonella enterica subsp. enterica serovar Kentucky]
NGPNEEADALYLIEALGKRGIAYLHMSEPDWAGGEPYSDAFREKVAAVQDQILDSGSRCRESGSVIQYAFSTNKRLSDGPFIFSTHI